MSGYVDMSFWSVTVRVHAHERDVRYLSWFFADHVVSKAGIEPALEIGLTCNDGEFMRMLPTDSAKEIWIKTPDRPWTLHERFRLQASKPSPVPPFALDPLRSQIQLAHAAMFLPTDVTASPYMATPGEEKRVWR